MSVTEPQPPGRVHEALSAGPSCDPGNESYRSVLWRCDRPPLGRLASHVPWLHADEAISPV